MEFETPLTLFYFHSIFYVCYESPRSYRFFMRKDDEWQLKLSKFNSLFQSSNNNNVKWKVGHNMWAEDSESIRKSPHENIKCPPESLHEFHLYESFLFFFCHWIIETTRINNNMTRLDTKRVFKRHRKNGKMDF